MNIVRLWGGLKQVQDCLRWPYDIVTLNLRFFFPCSARNVLFVVLIWSVLAVIVVKGNKTSNLRAFKLGKEYGTVGRDSAVGIATRYGLDGPEIESRWGRDFPHPPRPALGSTQLPIQWVPGLLLGVKRGRGLDHPHPSSAEVKERVELCFYSPSGPSWPVLGWNLNFKECGALNQKYRNCF
jgi:hypothetical protein